MMWWFGPWALAAPLEPVTPTLPVDPELPPVAAVDRPAIVGGAVASGSEAPEVAALFVADLYGCSGVLIAPDLVLSAGHCWSATTAEKSVILGASDYESDGERIVVVEDWRMPDHLETFDVAVFALERPATAAPARLVGACEADEVLYDGVMATIYGYGATDVDAKVETTALHRATIPVADHDCSEPDRGCRTAVAPGGELRAGGDGVDTCVGDSGGPLFVDTPDGRALAGVTSRSSLPAATDCGSGGLYVRADAIADWIEATTGRTLEPAPCTPSTEDPGPPGAPSDTGIAPPEGCGCRSPAPLSPGLALVALLTARARGRRRRRGAPPRRRG